MVIKIENIEDKRLQVYHAQRDKGILSDGSFIADSPKVVNLILEQSDIEIYSILATKEYFAEHHELIASRKIPFVYEASKAEISKVVGHKIHHNCMMHAKRPDDSSLCELDETILLLDNITSSENVGAVSRSMAALGVNSLMLGKTSPHPFNRRALRVSMGYASMLKIHVYEDIKESIKTLKSLGYTIYAAEVTEDAQLLSDVRPAGKWALIMGHEGFGIEKDILDLCDAVVSIEMQEGVKSFNVAIAASIMMYNFKNK
ncbi:TrmH family RNA methyltransferase [Sulfurimonas paralvinellae]|uniref:RNA methyltransferase n=1 Tax=Sulfurimonas paralvinellae TaxID=317658 RepID=A0A7M1BAL1_9BACT|nr:RNA methyltransferase [Sulfurimonas paralvinellae]QOP46760.1 RNA methyltransferase [Sulfurimonas paralvinellae]